MRYLLILTVLLAATLACLIGCEDDARSVGLEYNPVEFPNAVGHSWVYAKSWWAEGEMRRDTFIVDVTGTHQLQSGDIAQVWRFHCDDTTYPGATPSGYEELRYVVEVGDTVRIHWAPGENAVPPITLIKPFTTGNQWTGGGSYTDTISVTEKVGMYLTPGHFSNVPHIERDYWDDPCVFRHELFVIPDVGIGQIRFGAADTAAVPDASCVHRYLPEQWWLVSYDLADEE